MRRRPGDDAPSGPSPTAASPTAGSLPGTTPAGPTPAGRVGSLSIEYAMSAGPDTRVWELGPDGPVPLSLPAIGTFATPETYELRWRAAGGAAR